MTMDAADLSPPPNAAGVKHKGEAKTSRIPIRIAIESIQWSCPA